MGPLNRYIRIRRLLRILRFGFAERGISYPIISEGTRPRLLVIKTEAIGDYILFRNFLKHLKTSERFKDHELVLVGNNIWKGLAVSLDQQWVDRFFFIDRNKFQTDNDYRHQQLEQIAGLRYELAINATYSREFLLGDSIIRAVHAKEKIGMHGDDVSELPWVANLSTDWYSQLSDAGQRMQHEFSKNLAFFEELTGTSSGILSPEIAHHGKREPVVLVFPGANQAYRQWPAEKFGEVCKRLHADYGLRPVVAGSAAERPLGDIVLAKLPISVGENRCGEIDLSALPALVASSAMVLCNDSGTLHIAAATRTPAVCISNGNHFGRFIPYPSHIHLPLKFVFPPSFEKACTSYDQKVDTTKYGSSYAIDEVEVDHVFREAELLI